MPINVQRPIKAIVQSDGDVILGEFTDDDGIGLESLILNGSESEKDSLRSMLGVIKYTPFTNINYFDTLPENGRLGLDQNTGKLYVSSNQSWLEIGKATQASGTTTGGNAITDAEIEKFVYNSNYYQNNSLRKNTLRNKYNGIIRDRYEKKSGKKKLNKKYPGLIKNNYVIQTGSKIVVRKKTPTYFLTLKGCFFALGFELNKKQLSLLINNASTNHLFFYFLKLISEKTSFEIVKEIFILPIKDLIRRKRVDLSDEMYLNFGIIADAIGITLYEKRKNLFISKKSFWDDPEFNQIEELRKLIIYEQNPREDWYDSIVEFYYDNDDSLEFYEDFSEGQFEMSLFQKVMYQLLHGYHEAVPEDVPHKSGFKLPRSKRI